MGLMYTHKYTFFVCTAGTLVLVESKQKNVLGVSNTRAGY